MSCVCSNSSGTVTRFTSVLIVMDDPNEELSFMASSLSAEQNLVSAREKTGVSFGCPPFFAKIKLSRPYEPASGYAVSFGSIRRLYKENSSSECPRDLAKAFSAADQSISGEPNGRPRRSQCS